MVYLDYAANTPVSKTVLDLYYDTTIKYYGNPNSNHKMGFEAKELIDKATSDIASYLGVNNDEIIYTSGATESNNLAIKGIALRYKNYGKHIILSSLEHNSIIASASALESDGFDVDLVPITPSGLVDIDELKKMIRNDTILVSICAVDSEIGLVQPIEEIGKLLKQYPNVHFHTDATQAIGKAKIDYSNVDLITIAPHKFYGINGIGILVKKTDTYLKPIINGGKSTTIYRSGTPNLPAIVSTSLALKEAITMFDERYNYVLKLNKELLSFLHRYSNIHINNRDNSIPFTINFSILGTNSSDMVSLLNGHDIYVSAKTSCCPLETPSKLVYALTRDKKMASSSIRISLSHLTTMDEIKEFEEVFDNIMKEMK